MIASKLAALVLVAVGLACADSSEAPESETGPDAGEEVGDAPLRPTWHQDVAPIVHARCVGCHSASGVAPFSLVTHAEASPWASPLVEAVHAEQMPPWGAHETDECQPRHAWVDDPRLTADEIEVLSEWAELGAPEGDPADAAPLPELEDPALADVSDVLESPAPIVVAGQFDSFECVSLELGLDHDVWVTGVELLPDNLAVVHHALIFLDETGASAEIADPDGRYPCAELEMGSLLGSWFPGSTPTELPPEFGIRLPAGARVVMQYHYHPTGSREDVDHSRLAIRWTEQAPAYEAWISSVGNATSATEGLLPGPDDPAGVPTFAIPPDVVDHTETMQVVVPEWFPTAELFLLGPHMHAIGVDLRLTRTRAGETECLIQDPHWDPDWQSVYRVDAAPGEYPTLAAGDVLTLRCTYDNSLANPNLVEALASYGLDQPFTATMGSAGLDEMCMFVYGVALASAP